MQQISEKVKNWIGRDLTEKWTVSRARDTYGYNIVTLRHRSEVLARCNGGGYDMSATNLGNWIANEFRNELLAIPTSEYPVERGVRRFYGLTFHDPNFNPNKALIKLEDGTEMTVEDAEKAGKSFGLEAYQAFYRASSLVVTERHVVPRIDGACGFNSVEWIAKALGFCFKRIDAGKNCTIYDIVEYTRN